MTRKPRTETAPLTTAQQLASMVKSDIMRKDRGLAGPFCLVPFSISAFEPA